MFEMKPEYMTGIESIDKEHEELFSIAARAYDLMKNDYVVDKYDEIVTIINELKEYAVKHFTSEEAYMESIQYKKMFTQKIQHQQFLEKVNEYDLSHVDAHQNKTITDLLEFLSEWLVDHILENDILIGKE